MIWQESVESGDGIVAGFAWYKAQDWEAWQAVCPDFEPTFAEWEREAVQSLLEMRRRGVNVKKVTLDVESFLLWCSEQGRDRSSSSRAEYVSHLLEAKH